MHLEKKIEDLPVVGDDEETPEAEVFRKTLFIVAPTFFIFIGTVGNILVLIVLSQRSYQSSSHFTVAVRSLAFVDLVIVWSIVGRVLLTGIFGIEYLGQDSTECRIYHTYISVCTALVNWLVALVTIVRYMNVKFPFIINELLSAWRTFYIVIILTANLTAFSYVLDHPYEPTHFKNLFNVSTLCTTAPFVSEVEMPYKITKQLIDAILPGVLVTFFNILIYTRYKYEQRRRKTLCKVVATHAKRISILEQSLGGPQFGEDLPRKSEFSGACEDVGECRNVNNVDGCSHIQESRTSTNVDRNSIYRNSIKMTISQLLAAEQKELHLATQEILVLEKNEEFYDFIAPRDRTLMDNFKDAIVDIQDVLIDIHSRLPKVEKSARLLPTRSPTIPLILGTIVFLCINIPYTIWYISSDLSGPFFEKRASPRVVVYSVLILLKYGGSMCNCMMYNGLSTKFQQEYSRLVQVWRRRRTTMASRFMSRAGSLYRTPSRSSSKTWVRSKSKSTPVDPSRSMANIRL